MAKKTARRKTVGRERQTDEEVRSRGFNPFLRPEHCTDGELLALTGFNSQGDGQIKCEVQNERGETFTLGVRQGMPDHRILHHALGADWSRWAGTVKIKHGAGREGPAQFCNVDSAQRDYPFWYAEPGE